MITQSKSLFGILFLIQCCLILANCSPPPDPITCRSSSVDCTVTNSYGAFPDRSTCHASSVAYPTSEAELVDAVANATRAMRKMKVATKYVHSIPKLVCPGGDDGLLISTREMSRVVGIERELMTMTVESGMVLRDLIGEAAKVGMALPYTPYWWGVTVGGMLGTGAHGSSLWGKGGAVHEYVVGVRIVTPATADEGYAMVRSLDADHPDLDAAKVNLGVLGVISQITLSLQPLFKRSVTYSEQNESNLPDVAEIFGKQHEFADIRWYPSQHSVIYRIDDRVPINTTGDGFNDFTLFSSTPTLATAFIRSTEEAMEASDDAEGKCAYSLLTHSMLVTRRFGLIDNGVPAKGYPVIGFQDRMQSAGSCLTSPEDFLLTSCPWDSRFRFHMFFYQSAISVPLSKARDLILDIQQLRDLHPQALCAVDLYDGILMRYVKGSKAYMGKEEDSLDFLMSYYRSHDPMSPRLNEDVMEEIEQMALSKYGGIPHWGKNQNMAFDGVIDKYSKSKEFLRVKNEYDPQGLFSSEWTDQVLGIEGRSSIFRNGCALEGLCVCSEDLHCAPDKGYFCRPGKVYKDARVCAHSVK